MLRTSPRLFAALGALVYALGLVVLPALHLAGHRSDHSHGVASAKPVDWERVRDPQSGRVDLERLAHELGLSDQEHSKSHAEGRTHKHGDEAPASNDLQHGLGAAEHYSLSLLGATPLLLLTHSVVVLPVPPVPDDVQAPTLELRFLETQRAQAPPV